MNSQQLQLAADLAAEYEQGESPEWEAHTEHGWGRLTTQSSLRLAVIAGHTIRRVDPYQRFKDALASGKRVRYRGGPWRCSRADSFAWGGDPSDYEIEPDWQLPPPPPGRQWQRADEWKQEMLPEGYRPMLIGETGSYEYLCSIAGWREGRSLAVPSNNHGASERTNRPLPGTTPLTVDDVPFGARFRRTDKPTGSMAATVAADYVTLLGDLSYTWDAAVVHLEMSTDGVTWRPCTK